MIVMLQYISHVMENDKVMKETVHKRTLAHSLFLNFQMCFSQIDIFVYSPLPEKKGRYDATLNFNIN